MKPTAAVSFETYYFHQLLDTIRERAEAAYPADAVPYVQRLLQTLESASDVQAGIEQLALSQTTSDLAIFFSDIVEQLGAVDPDTAVARVPNRADDFLEIFQLILQDPQWREAMDASLPASGDAAAMPGAATPHPVATSQTASATPPVEPEGDVDVRDFIRHTLAGAVSRSGLAPDSHSTFQTMLDMLCEDPDRAERLREAVPDPRVEAFIGQSLDLSYDELRRDPAAFMVDFPGAAERWVATGAALFADHGESMSNAVREADAAETRPEAPVEAVEPEAMGERPFESLFEEAEVDSEADATDESPEDPELAETAEALERRKPQRQPISEEERERKRFLRDYVVGEVESFATEILTAADGFRGRVPDAASAAPLKESLKGLKDLGQIHAYPMLEQSAEELIHIFAQLREHERPMNDDDLTELRRLLDHFPGYVDAVIAQDAAEVEGAIRGQLDLLDSRLLDADSSADLRSAETMEVAFQDVVQRSVQRIDEALHGSGDAAALAPVGTVLANLHFWSDTLQLGAARDTVEMLGDLCTPERFARLSGSDRQMLSDIVMSWQTAFVTHPESVWFDYQTQLSDLLAATDPGGAAVTVSEAAPAFRDVAARRLRELAARPSLTPAGLQPVLLRLAGDGRLAGATTLAGILERAAAGTIAGDPGAVCRNAAAAIEHDDAEALAGHLAFAPAVADVHTGEEDIQDVFRMEALNYIQEMTDALNRLGPDPGNREAMHDLGVSAHTLRGSAQMVGRGDIAELAEPFDKAIELVESNGLPVQPKLIEIFTGFVSVLKERIDGRAVDTNAIMSQLSDYVSMNASEGPAAAPAPEPAPEAAPPAVEPSPEPEADVIVLAEQDTEMLELFQNEVINSFDEVEKHLANIAKFAYDKEALQQIERSVHEIRGAAKMLGIGEVAGITDQLERLFELLIQQKLADFDGAIATTRRAMHVIRELTTRHKVRRDLYDNVRANLDAVIAGKPAVDLPETPPAPAAAPEPVPADRDEDDSTDFTPRTDTLLGDSGEDEGGEVSRDVLELYLEEAREQLEDIDYLLLNLEKDPGNQELQNHLMRCMHTLKGSSAMVYARNVERLAHRSEDLLENTVNRGGTLTADLFDLLSDVVKEITFIQNGLRDEGKESTHRTGELLSRLENRLSRTPQPAPEPQAEAAPDASGDGERSGRKDTYLRLNINKMNHLLNLAAELVISNNQFKAQLNRLKNMIPQVNQGVKQFQETEDFLNRLYKDGQHLEELVAPLVEKQPGTRESLRQQSDKLGRAVKTVKNLQDEMAAIGHTLRENSKTYDENLQKLNKLSNELLEEIMQARLVPINMLFQRFHRPIRDLARQMQKQIRLELSGEETELDRTLVDELFEPLLHIIRNAIDHGIETRDERAATGKNPEGHLEIRASRDRNQVIIEVRDDGRGIDLEAIKASAIARGLMTSDDAGQMSDQELFEYLFYPGFSTAKETTLVSGRGVGLDAVKVQIEKAKGDIRMSTTPGGGTTFTIRVPVSLSVIQSMLVDVGGHVYSIPLMQVEETLHVSGQDILSDEGTRFIRYREADIPVIQLGRLLRMREPQENPIVETEHYSLILVQDEGTRVALMVDKIIRREEILIKSLGPGLRRLKYISGGSIMADGQVVLVLDIPQIIQTIVKRGPAAEGAAPEPAGPMPLVEQPAAPPAPSRGRKTISDRKPVALIVDDSLSIRKYLSNLLLQKGYATESARNGYEALEWLNKQSFDIMVTDLEMPKLSGYELIETLRYDKRFADFPIVVLTGRAGENFRQLTSELGADAYIIKPFKDRELFEQIEKFIDYRPS